MTPSESSRRLFLVDGSALAYRSHFAFIRTPLSNRTGLNTGAILGYTRALKVVLDREAPTHMAVVFDPKGDTFRNEMYPAYKATREKMPEEMSEQLPWMHRITEALNIPLIVIEGYEADDVIGTLARRAENEGYHVFIVTGDKDFMQIVSDRVTLYDIMKPGQELVLVDPAGVEAKFGVPPDKVIDVLALMGDKSDNVPGVTGVGEKTAMDLVHTFGDVDGVLANVADIKKKRVRENIEAERDMLILSRRLVTIDLEAPVDLTPADLELGELNKPALDEILKTMEFRSLRDEFDTVTSTAPAVEKDYRIVMTEAELDALIEELESAPFSIVDLETTSLDTLDARIVGVGFSMAVGQGHYVPLNSDPALLGDESGQAVLERLRGVLEDPARPMGGQNIKYDMSVFATAGVELRGVTFDTMIASYLLEPGARDHNLDGMSQRHFDYTKIKTAELIGSGKEEITMDLAPVEAVGEYACEDVDFTYRLYDLFDDKLGKGDLRRLFDEIEMPLVPVLMRMERAGVKLDTAVLKGLATEIEASLATLEREIYDLAGREFSIASPKQMSVVLFEELELHKQLGVRPRRTKTGFSTNHEVLEAMAAHPLPAKILEHRTLAKLLSTYVVTLPQLVHPSTGRIHTSYGQAVAATGRLSSYDPNLQNIPVRTALGRRVRSAFVAGSEDNVLMSADYSQVELRIMAHLAGDPAMIESFRRGADIHADTAARVFGVEPEAVDGGMRARAKSINFGIMYGMGPQRLARETAMTVEEAQQFIQRYFDTFPTVRDFLDSMKEQAREKGYVTTLYGRRRPLPDMHSKNGRLRAAAENMAVNTPLQGTAADIIKMAMIAVDDWIRGAGVAGRMILQVHDELVFDVPQVELETFLEEIPALMSGVVDLAVPLSVETGHGKDWTAAH